MSEKKPGDIMVSPSGGVFKDIIVRLKLVLRLMGDPRVNIFVKILPIVSLAYLIWPIDLIAGIPGLSALDDIAIVSLGNYLFVELCPPDVVNEHMKSLTSNLDSAPPSDEIVDAEATDLPSDKK
ncbi:MAG: hypothetical protein A3K45_04880 [Chloroflexi bacterium RIFOXYC12_FULL_59_14]|nr:MAG: hypothetical protein A3K45_04880 [Chloroflexi bacterium RIFOXYC12_FULL_59_14]